MRFTGAMPYPVGTTVDAYVQASLGGGVPSTGPTGAAVASTTVGSDGKVTFTGLVPDTEYWAHAVISGKHRWTGFRTQPSTAVTVEASPDEVPLRVRANAAQTANIVEVEAEDGGDYWAVGPTGVVHSTSPFGPFVVDVGEFGAVGDGVTDDTLAIQAAIDFVDKYLGPSTYGASRGGAVDFALKKYRITASLYTDARIRLRGVQGVSAGGATSQIVADPAGNYTNGPFTEKWMLKVGRYATPPGGGYWWHSGTLENLSFDAAQTPGLGIFHCWGAGENSLIDRVEAKNTGWTDRTLSDVAFTAGSRTITSASGAFTQDDVTGRFTPTNAVGFPTSWAADHQILSAVRTQGSAVITAASGPFTSADLGKQLAGGTTTTSYAEPVFVVSVDSATQITVSETYRHVGVTQTLWLRQPQGLRIEQVTNATTAILTRPALTSGTSGGAVVRRTRPAVRMEPGGATTLIGSLNGTNNSGALLEIIGWGNVHKITSLTGDNNGGGLLSLRDCGITADPMTVEVNIKAENNSYGSTDLDIMGDHDPVVLLNNCGMMHLIVSGTATAGVRGNRDVIRIDRSNSFLAGYPAITYNVAAVNPNNQDFEYLIRDTTTGKYERAPSRTGLESLRLNPLVLWNRDLVTGGNLDDRMNVTANIAALQVDGALARQIPRWDAVAGQVAWRDPTVFEVQDFDSTRKIGDAAFALDAAMTSASAVVTSTSAGFTSADVGKSMVVQGAGASGAHLVTTIASFQSGTQVTLAATAGTTRSGVRADWGTDSTAAFNAAIDAAAAAGGGEVKFGAKPYLFVASQTQQYAWHGRISGHNIRVSGAGSATTLRTPIPGAVLIFALGEGIHAGSYANWNDPSHRLTGLSLAAMSAAVEGDMTLTLTTPANLTTPGNPVYQLKAGDLVYIRTGQNIPISGATLGQPDAETNEVLDVNTTTGVIGLRYPLAKPYSQEYSASSSTGPSSTTVQAYSWPFGVAKATGYVLRGFSVAGLRLEQIGAATADAGTLQIGEAFDWRIEDVDAVVNDGVGAGNNMCHGSVDGLRVHLRSGRRVRDAAITSGAAALTSATGQFMARDVGQSVRVAGAGASGAILTTTISAWVSPTQVTLAANASTTVSAANADIGRGYGWPIGFGTGSHDAQVDGLRATHEQGVPQVHIKEGCSRIQLNQPLLHSNGDAMVPSGNSMVDIRSRAYGVKVNQPLIVNVPTGITAIYADETCPGGGAILGPTVRGKVNGASVAVASPGWHIHDEDVPPGKGVSRNLAASTLRVPLTSTRKRITDAWIRWDDAADVTIGTLPAAAIITGVYMYLAAQFNAATTATLSLGTVAFPTNYINAKDIKTPAVGSAGYWISGIAASLGTTATLNAKLGTGTLGTIPAVASDIHATWAQTGAAATTGLVYVALEWHVGLVP